MSVRSLAPIAALVAALLLSACGSRPPAAPPGPAAAESSGHGIYKVGQPYQINGVWYYPKEDFAYDETGIASWYGEDFHGKFTANGEVFNLNALTAAHRTLPMPSIVEVTNLDNGRSMALRVNDRGPYKRGRIIDLSRRAAQLLGFEGTGTARVRVRILVPESIQAASLARKNGGEDRQVADAAQAAPRDRVTAEALPGAPGMQVASTEVATLPPPAAGASAVAAPAIAEPPPPAPQPLPEQVTVEPVKATQLFVQAGAYAVGENALRVKSRIDALGPVKVYAVRVNGVDLYRVRLGPVASVAEADRLLGRVIDAGLGEARIVVD